MQADHSAESVAATTVFIDHSVTFQLGAEEQFVAPGRGANRYVRVDWISISFLANGQTWTAAGGIVCKKDGTFSERWGRTSVSVDLPNPVDWIERASALIDGCEGA